MAELGPEHISAYSLIIEEGTPFYGKYGGVNALRREEEENFPDEDTERMMYQFTKIFCGGYGYHRYGYLIMPKKKDMNLKQQPWIPGTAQNIWESEPVGISYQ